jgi:predicted glycosyltransferase involved in capsule biosynthesis
MNELTVIIPIRAIGNRDISERLTYGISDYLLNRNKIDFIVVDDGSAARQKEKHKEICERLGIQYHYLDTENKSVNMARARNVGVGLAKTKYIMFMDVDLYPYPGFYNDILDEIDIQKLAHNQNDLIMVSVIYLTEKEGNPLFFNTDENKRKTLFLQKLSENDKSVIEKFSTGTSVALYHRSRYLEIGGYDEEFCEWGYEDLEFNLRMMCSSDKFPVPDDFHLDYKTFQTIDEYRGWKSLYKKYGEITMQRDIVLFHIWHEVDKNSKYVQGYEKNRQLFVKKISKLCLESKKTGTKDSFYVRYKNSSFIVLMQHLKKVPFAGKLLLYIKQKILQWK